MQGWHQFPINYWSPFCVMYLDGKLLRNTSCCHNQVTDSVLVSKHLGPSFSHHEISVNANSERVAHKIAHTWLQCQANIKHFNIPEPVTRVRDILIHCREKEGWGKKKDTQNFAGLQFHKPNTLGIYCTFTYMCVSITNLSKRFSDPSEFCYKQTWRCLFDAVSPLTSTWYIQWLWEIQYIC